MTKTASTRIALVGTPAMVSASFEVLAEIPFALVTDVAVVGRPSWQSPADAQAYAGAEPLLDSTTADVVFVGAGPRNAELATRALDRGLDVVLVAPWQLNPAQFTELAVAAHTRGRRLLFSQSAIWAGDILVAARAIKLKGERPAGVRGTFVATDTTALVEEVEQAVAVARVLIGEMPDNVSAAGGLHQASLQLFHSDARNAQFQLSAGEPRRERTVTLIADGRSWRLELTQSRRLEAGSRDGRVVSLRTVEASPLRSPVGMEMVHLLRTYLADEEPVLSAAAAYEIAVTVEAVQRSLLAFGAPVQPSSLVEPLEEPDERPRLRAIAGGGRTSTARAALTVVS